MNIRNTILNIFFKLIIILSSSSFCEHHPAVQMGHASFLGYGPIDSEKGTFTIYKDRMTMRLMRKKRKAADSSLLWPNATVPFTYGIPGPDKQAIIAGMSHWEKHTCIRFIEVSDQNSPHVVYRDLGGCRSSVGRINSAGQNISIGETCTEFGIVVHEIGHSLGFYHEIRRPDRDDYVVVNNKNIETEELFNFYKVHWLNSSVPYDLSSVMHYTSMEWSKNGKTTVATKDPMLQGILDIWKSREASGLSHRDKYLANKIYGCLQTWLSKCKLADDPCKGEGFLGQHCHCICPPGTSGTYCEHKVGTYYDDLKSQCSHEITYETIITSPNYPNNYDPDTWCVYIVNGSQCRSPVLTILDFQMGPRDLKEQCYHDFLEIRNDSLYDGFKKCGTEVTPGLTVFSKDDTMILYFKGDQGGYRGFKGKISFVDMIDCCRTIRNNTAYHVLSPQYPRIPKNHFNCTVDLHAIMPAKVKVMNIVHQGEDDNYFLPSISSPLSLPCGLMLCQLTGCKSECNNSKNDSSSVMLPNSGTTHHFTSSKLFKGIPMHLVFQLVPSSCHKIIEITMTNPSGQLLIGSEQSEMLQCEWWIKAPTNNHVKFFVGNLRLKKSEHNYLAINEAGDPSFPEETSKIFKSSDLIPKFMVSINAMVIVVLQSQQTKRVRFDYELYNCTDNHEECTFWSSIGECNQNPQWMLENCKYSCNLCEFSIECKDYNQDCSFWAENNQCKENEEWMSINCQMSCGHCNSCENRNPLCESWGVLGHCQSQAKYMKNFCPRTCQFCNVSSGPSNSRSEKKITNELKNGPKLEINIKKQIERSTKESDVARIFKQIHSEDVDGEMDQVESNKIKKDQSYRLIEKERRLKDIMKKNIKKKIMTMVNHSISADINDNIVTKFRKLRKSKFKRVKINQKYKYSKTYRSSNQINNLTSNKIENLQSPAKKYKPHDKLYRNINATKASSNNMKEIFNNTRNKTKKSFKAVNNFADSKVNLSANKSYPVVNETSIIIQNSKVKKKYNMKEKQLKKIKAYPNISNNKFSNIKEKFRVSQKTNKKLNFEAPSGENQKVINKRVIEQPNGIKRGVKKPLFWNEKNIFKTKWVNTPKFAAFKDKNDNLKKKSTLAFKTTKDFYKKNKRFS